MPIKDREQKLAYHKEYNKTRNVTPEQKKYNKDRALRRRKEVQQRLDEYKKTLSCVRCGFSHPAALDFHHRNTQQKEFSLAHAAQRGMGWERIMDEIEKCDVLCANCHRIEHAFRGN